MNTTPEKTEIIQGIVLDLIPDLSKKDISDDADIFELGLDSINAMTLVFNLQEAFSIKFDASEISIENFRCVADIAKLVEGKGRAEK
jgi:acyl carrier protein